MSDWDDLFQAAAGVGGDNNDHFNDNDNDNDNDNGFTSIVEIKTDLTRKHQVSKSNRSDKRQKKESRRTNQHIISQKQCLESVLDSRNEIIIWKKLPPWLSPGASFNSRLCCQWEQNNNNDDDVDCFLNARCKNCELSILHHSLSVTSFASRGQAGMVLKAFALVRDIRCCCSSILNEAYGYKYNSNKTQYTNFDHCINAALNKSDSLVIMDFRSILPAGEADILVRKFDNVKNGATYLCEKSKHWSKGKQKMDKHFKLRGIFDEIVQLMIYCDGVYYRMYYLQTSGHLPIDKNIFIPHPPTYFGSNNMVWNTGKDHTLELVETLKKSCTTITDKRWDDLNKYFGVGQPPCEQRVLVDPLSYMHKNRLSESIFIFHKSSWIHSAQAKKQTIRSTNHILNPKTRDREELFYAIHETPGPDIVKEWRDSCRDILCNLYAYATLSPRTINDVKDTLRENDIMELGAGIGYIAHLLSGTGLNVSAFDIAPTKRGHGQHDDNSNVYHGSSPPFYHVDYADDVRSILGKREAKKIALCLCYPPPLSSMAVDSLKSFVNLGGKSIIHIGEFSGLTGCPKFERFLTHHFDLKYRAPCLHWGTDTGEVTLWSKREEPFLKKSNTVVSIQCSQCKNINATLRLRLCRTLSYCSSSCFDAHKAERRIHFAFNMIPDIMNGSDILSRQVFGSKQYFESINTMQI